MDSLGRWDITENRATKDRRVLFKDLMMIDYDNYIEDSNLYENVDLMTVTSNA